MCFTGSLCSQQKHEQTRVRPQSTPQSRRPGREAHTPAEPASSPEQTRGFSDTCGSLSLEDTPSRDLRNAPSHTSRYHARDCNATKGYKTQRHPSTSQRPFLKIVELLLT